MSLRADKANLQKRFDATFVEEADFGPKYVQNAFTFPKWPVISLERPSEIRLMNWGLIPSWMRDVQTAMKFRAGSVNARAETIFNKPAFRKAAVENRCLVLADGFFEYREVAGKKYPYYIRVVGGEPFALAGLFDRWANPETGEVIQGFAVVTTTANPLLEMIHNLKKRMPVILPREQERKWLQPGEDSKLLLTPFPEKKMEAWTVSRKISDRVGANGFVTALDPVDYPELSDESPKQGLLF
jgi:putative SOS response-associated peptidase YedK